MLDILMINKDIIKQFIYVYTIANKLFIFNTIVK